MYLKYIHAIGPSVAHGAYKKALHSHVGMYNMLRYVLIYCTSEHLPVFSFQRNKHPCWSANPAAYP